MTATIFTLPTATPLPTPLRIGYRQEGVRLVKIRHVVSFIGFGFLTLSMMCGGLMFWESETHTLERHFEAREQRLMAELEPVLTAAVEGPKVSAVVGSPLERCVRISWSRNSTPFGDSAAYELAARGPKGDATIDVAFKYRDNRWNLEKFDVQPAPEPFKAKIFEENHEWNTPLSIEMDDLDDLDEEIETSVTLEMEKGGLVRGEGPTPPTPPRIN